MIAFDTEHFLSEVTGSESYLLWGRGGAGSVGLAFVTMEEVE